MASVRPQTLLMAQALTMRLLMALTIFLSCLYLMGMPGSMAGTLTSCCGADGVTFAVSTVLHLVRR